jgi:hypothetical protein
VETHHATARDISGGGIGFQCRKSISQFTPVRINLAGDPTSLTAVVTHCTPALVGHIIGAEFRLSQAGAGQLRVLKVG